MRALLALSLIAAAGCAEPRETDACGPADSNPVSPCTTPPPSRCDGDVRVVYHAAGRCTEDASGAAVCDYPIASQQDCAALQRVCRDAQCVEPTIIPCAGVTCFTPPGPDCDGNVSRIYGATGTCDAATGDCEYPVSDTLDCTPSSSICVDGACSDPSDTPCDPNPCDVPPQGSCNGNVPQLPATIGACGEIGSTASCTYTTSNGNACDGATPECRHGRCATGVGTPLQPGVLVISEIMKRPAIETGANTQRDWLEIHNPTTLSLELDGCEVAGATVPNIELFVPAGGFVVVGAGELPQQSGGFDPDFRVETLSFDNASGSVAIVCNGTTIDSVAWAADWPMGAGRAMSLDPQTGSASDNDLLASWCDAPDTYGDRTNRGSPRRVNPACP